MEQLKKYFQNNFEKTVILIVLTALLVINYLIPQKIAFLNLYFVPIVLAGYYLDLKFSISSAVICILFVTLYSIFFSHLFVISDSSVDIFVYIISWGSLLIFTAAVVGALQQRLRQDSRKVDALNKKLQEQEEEFNKSSRVLKVYSEDFEGKMKKRTGALEKKKEDIETFKNKIEKVLYTTMDSSVVKLMTEGRLLNEKRMVSVLFSDLTGFTEYSEGKSPELLIRDLNNYLNDMEPILLNYKGHIDKYMGDGIMVEFGAPIDFNQYRLLSVLAAIKMQERMARVKYPWNMRIGIASGPSIIGLIGGSKRQSYTAIGDIVNLASRMENVCSPGSILIDEFTKEGISRFIDVRLKKAISYSETHAEKVEEKLEILIRKLNMSSDDKEKANLYYQLGCIHMSLDEVHDAVSYYERAMKIQPDNADLKVAFAEATIKRDKKEKIMVRGRKQRVAAYEVVGIKDMLLDSNKISESFHKQYSQFENLLTIDEEAILPIEALDGCIGHSKVVAILSYAIASEFDRYEEEKIEILHAGFISDIGKGIIPHHILNFSDSGLSDSELKEVKKHPIESVRILKEMGYDSEMMLKIIRHSHENYDGSGYPDGLQGDAIPFGSRIVAVADAYDALTSWRPYRDRWDQNATFDELNRCVEKGLYDPEVVKILIRLLS